MTQTSRQLTFGLMVLDIMVFGLILLTSQWLWWGVLVGTGVLTVASAAWHDHYAIATRRRNIA